MSLIQEALKRQQEDMRGKVDPAAPPVQELEQPKQVPKPQRLSMAQPPPTPPPIPDAPTQPETTKTEPQVVPPDTSQPKEPHLLPETARSAKVSLKKPILVVVVTGLFAIASFVMLVFTVMKFLRKPAEPAAVLTETTEQNPAPEVRPPDPKPSKQPETQQPTPPPVVGETIKTQPAHQTPSKAKPQPQAVVEPVEWPLLTVDGLLGRGNEGSALINKRIINVGESIEGVHLTGIGIQGVNLEYAGEKKFVKVNGSTR